MTKKLISRIAFTPTEKFIKIQDIATSNKYNLTLEEVQNIIAERNKNGLKDAVKQIGNRCFIREHLFDEWYTSEMNTKKI
jgi:hypothetical protein